MIAACSETVLALDDSTKWILVGIMAPLWLLVIVQLAKGPNR